MQAGHFWQSGNYPNTRYDERNVHAQCVGCNVMKNGMELAHMMHIRKKYGEEVLNELEQKAHVPRKYNEIELLAIEKLYLKKAKEEAKKRGIVL